MGNGFPGKEKYRIKQHIRKYATKTKLIVRKQIQHRRPALKSSDSRKILVQDIQSHIQELKGHLFFSVNRILTAKELTSLVSEANTDVTKTIYLQNKFSQLVDIYTMEAYWNQLIEYRNSLLFQQTTGYEENKITSKGWSLWKVRKPTGDVTLTPTVQVPYKHEE